MCVIIITCSYNSIIIRRLNILSKFVSKTGCLIGKKQHLARIRGEEYAQRKSKTVIPAKKTTTTSYFNITITTNLVPVCPYIVLTNIPFFYYLKLTISVDLTGRVQMPE